MSTKLIFTSNAENIVGFIWTRSCYLGVDLTRLSPSPCRELNSTTWWLILLKPQIQAWKRWTCYFRNSYVVPWDIKLSIEPNQRIKTRVCFSFQIQFGCTESCAIILFLSVWMRRKGGENSVDSFFYLFSPTVLSTYNWSLKFISYYISYYFSSSMKWCD